MFNCYNIQNFNQLYHGQIQIYLPQYYAPCKRERFRRLCPYPRARLAESALPVRQDRGMEHGQRVLCSGIPIQRFQHEGVVYPQRELGDETNRLASNGRSARSRVAHFFFRSLLDRQCSGCNLCRVSPDESASRRKDRHR